MSGINETREMLRALGALKREVSRLLADGFQLADLAAIWDKYEQDADFQKLVNDAVNGWQAIGVELNDLDVFEGFQLIRELLEAVRAKQMAAQTP